MKITETGVNNPVFVKIVLLLIFVVGGASFLSLPRYMDPDVNINYVVVVTINPGMAPEDVERLITQKVEDAVEGLEDIDRIMSVSKQGVSSVQIEFFQSVKDMKYKETKVNNAVNLINDFPEHTEVARVIEITTAFFPICEIALSADLPEKTLKDLADRLSERIEDIAGVGEARVFGEREREIWIEIDPARMEAYGLSINEVNLAVARRTQNIPGGTFDLGNQKLNVRIVGEHSQWDQLGDIALISRPDGGTVYLRDIATIRDTFEDAYVKVKEGDRPSFLLQVKRKKGADTVQILEKIKVLLQQFQDQEGQGIHMTLFNDTSREIRNRISDLQRNAFMGFVLVFILLAYALGGRNAVFAGFGIPVSFLCAFTMMSWYDLSLDSVSLFALILLLGIVVDDAIIILENILRHMEMGKPKRQAAIEGAKEVTLPITAATFTTIAAFAPLLLVTGIMGKFITEIPLVVIFTLLASLFEAFFMMPSHVAEYGVLPSKSSKKNFDLFPWLQSKLGKQLFYVLRHRYIVVPVLLFALACGSLLAWSVLEIEMFPSSDVFPRFDIKCWLPDGTRLEETQTTLEEIAASIRKTLPSEVLNTTIGISGMVEVEYQIEMTPHVGTVQVLLKDNYKEIGTVPDFIEKIRPVLDAVPSLQSYQIDRKKEGPPSGAPVYVEIRGENWTRLEEVSKRLQNYLSTVDGVYDIRDDYSTDRRELWIEIDEAKARLLGVDHGVLADTVNTAFHGRDVAVYHEEDEELDIVVKLQEGNRSRLDDVRNLKVRNRMGGFVTVADIAKISLRPGIDFIRHSDTKRTITVSAQLDDQRTTSQTVNSQIQKKIPEFLQGYPDCLVTFSGEYKRNQEVFQSIFMSFLLSIFLIYLILGTQFHSFIQPLVIMTVVPFSSIGVFGGLLLTGNRLTFPAMIGIVALTGIVVNDSLVLVDFINRHRRKGHPIFTAIVRASKIRLRPIILTSITTIAGLLPMALGIGGASLLWSPLANAIIFGLTTSTLLTLFIVPLVYAIAEDFKHLVSKLWIGSHRKNH